MAKKTTRQNLIFVILPLVLGLVLGLLWRGLYLPPDPDGRDFALNNRPLPPMTFTAFASNGKTKLDGGGNAMVINVFASWCVPCVAEMPLLLKLKPLLANEDVRLIGINWQDKKEAAQGFLQTHGNPFDQIMADNDGKAMIELGLVGVPETYFVDKNGIVRFRKIGPLTSDKDIEDFLKNIKQWQ